MNVTDAPEHAPRPEDASSAATAGQWLVPTGELTHRTDPADSFVTGWRAEPGGRFTVRVEWPRRHRFFDVPGTGRQDPLLLAETTRQVTMMLAHAAYGAPLDDHFVMHSMHFTAVPGAPWQDWSEPVSVTAACRARAAGRRPLHTLVSELDFHRGGRLLGRGGGSLTALSATAYRRLRGGAAPSAGAADPAVPPVPPVVPVVPPEGLPPEAVARGRARDVVLAPGPHEGSWWLRLDVSHPTLFRRPNDHVPGLLLLEAARQVAVAGWSPRFAEPASAVIGFSRYAALDRPCLLTGYARPDAGPGAPVVETVGEQDGAEVFRAVLTGPAA